MRITLCVDAVAPGMGGIGRYTWELCKGLQSRDDLDVQFFARNRLISDPAILVTGEALPRRRRGFRKLASWWDRRSLRGHLFHGPNYFLPAFVERGVITVHDLSVFRHPETHPAERIAQFEHRFEDSMRRASAIITDTETIRQELIADFGLEPNRVTAIHLGVDGKFRPGAAAASPNVLKSLGLEFGRYALCVSTLEPRKKIAELLACWQRLPVHLRQAFPLVLVGGVGWRNAHLQSAIKQGQDQGWLRHLGFVDEEVLPLLYDGAKLFLYPSIYEGFGLPPLEAMASGTPTIVSSRSCLPEVCGDAVRYIDPDDPEDFLSQTVFGLSNDEWHKDAARRGLLQASKFSWDRCIEEMIRLYRAVDATSGRF